MGDKEAIEYARNFGTLANGIVLFSVVQMISFMMAIGASNSTIVHGVTLIRPRVIVGIFIATALYSLLIAWLGHIELSLWEPFDGDKARLVRSALIVLIIARCLAVVTINGVGVWVVANVTIPVKASS